MYMYLAKRKGFSLMENGVKFIIPVFFISLSLINHQDEPSEEWFKTKFLSAYPMHLDSISGDYLYWKDGTMMSWNDGCIKSDVEASRDPDLQDQVAAIPYLISSDTPSVHCNPGTIRFQPFFDKMYGSNEEEIRRNLVFVPWFGKPQRIAITKVNDVDKKLTLVYEELKSKPHLLPWISDIAGTFVYRNILGTSQKSMHAYGIAIDINVKDSHYWKWDYKEWANPEVESAVIWRNKIPMEIVEIFEKQGFIWGGRWHRYDTMHFEYRPELLDRTI
jgi:peptidoglycan LD-endopeptidase CwlK